MNTKVAKLPKKKEVLCLVEENFTQPTSRADGFDPTEKATNEQFSYLIDQFQQPRSSGDRR